MSMQPGYSRNGNHIRQFYSSTPSMHTSDSGYSSSREMGPPPSLDFPPQPIEIDKSRTLPSPSPSSSLAWDSSFLTSHAVPDMNFTYGGPMARIQQLPVDRNTAQAPLIQWYTDNDGPWCPKGISEGISDERTNAKIRSGNRAPVAFGGQYRQQEPLDNGAFHFGAPPQSDSGYGTRRSVGNASIFSADVTDRDQDCQSLTGHVADFQPFQGMNETLQSRDTRMTEPWPLHIPTVEPPGLFCQVCHTAVKTKSELKKHDLRHRKPFVCTYPGCDRTEGFSTTNDLDRHTKSKHPSAASSKSEPTKKYKCHVPGCKSKDKAWPRLDNFRSHLKRLHQDLVRTDVDFEETIRLAEYLEGPGLSQEQNSSNAMEASDRSHSHTGNPDADAPDADPNRGHMSSCSYIPSNGSTARLGQKGFDNGFNSIHEPLFNGQRQSEQTIVNEDNVEASRVVEYGRATQSWKPAYPTRIPDLVDPMDKPFLPDVKARNSSSNLDPNLPQSTSNSRDTVQPSDLIRDPTKGITKISLESVLLTPVGTKSAIGSHSHSDYVDRLSDERNAPAPPQGKATRHDNISTSDATITEVIRSALAEVKIPSIGVSPLGRKVLPNGKPSPADSRLQQTDTYAVSDEFNKQSTSAFKDDSLDQEQAVEVLKTLQKLGYIIQRDPSRSPRIPNLGSAASNKSNNQVTCQICKNFRGRPCELKKHMKRHERPYGCTFLTCNKTFGSKNDWKRHENSQHFQLETWRCNKEKPEGGPCTKVCYRKLTFQEHLKEKHHMLDPDAIKVLLEDCRIGRNCQARFWCGFCTKLVGLKRKGLEAWTERFDHIDNHFMGRGELKKQGIRDWIPVDSDKPKGDVSSPFTLEESSPKDGREDSSGPANNSGRSSPDSIGTRGSSSAHAIILDGDESRSSKKRESDDDGGRPSKHKKVTAMFYCCQCSDDTGHTLSQACFSCNHHFCSDCAKDEI